MSVEGLTVVGPIKGDLGSVADVTTQEDIATFHDVLVHGGGVEEEHVFDPLRARGGDEEEEEEEDKRFWGLKIVF